MVIFQLRSWFDFKPRFKPEIMKQNSELLAGQFNSWHDALPAGKKAHGVYLTSDSTQGIDALAKVRVHYLTHTVGYRRTSHGSTGTTVKHKQRQLQILKHVLAGSVPRVCQCGLFFLLFFLLFF